MELHELLGIALEGDTWKRARSNSSAERVW